MMAPTALLFVAILLLIYFRRLRFIGLALVPFVVGCGWISLYFIATGQPVGFVSAVESKEALLPAPFPFIAARGRKGGSTVAVSLLNALLRLADAGHP